MIVQRIICIACCAVPVALAQAESASQVAEKIAELSPDVLSDGGLRKQFKDQTWRNLRARGDVVNRRDVANWRAIKTREDFDKYPWDTIEKLYFDKWSTHFEVLRETMPEGMKAVGGPGNGIFECVQDIVGYQDLCLLSVDDPVLYSDLFSKVGDVNFRIWKRFLEEFGDIYAVCRFGDDLGFRSSTLISAQDIKEMIIPQYKRIVELVHSYDKPFLLHSCGCIFNVMDDIIKIAGIDAKHSNEDAIGPFSVWIEKYGDRIGNFGGIDMDVLCQSDSNQIKQYIFNVMDYSKGHGGIAIGSGNSIPDYVPTEGYLAMINAVRECRGDF